MAYLKAAIVMTLRVYTSSSFIDCYLQMGWFILTSASRGPSAIAELLFIPLIRANFALKLRDNYN